MAVFNEDTRVKIPATIQFMRIGYNYQSLEDGIIDFNTKIFINRFKPAMEKINSRSFSDDEIKALLNEIDAVIRYNDLGKAFYEWLVNPMDRVKLIDFDNIDSNDFAVVDELPYAIEEDTEAGSFRPDINVLINGMPLGFLEVKKPNNDGGIQAEFDRMIKQRLKKTEFKKHFNMLQVVSFSNNMEYEDPDDADDIKAGSFYTTPNGNKTTFSFFREDSEKYHEMYPMIDIDDETIKEVTKDLGYNPENCDTPEFRTNLNKKSPCNSFITSLFDKERLLYLIHYGIAFIDGAVPEKHIMRYPQFFATRKILERLDNGIKDANGKISHNGIIWHTQGSGKTALAAFSNRIIADYYSRKDINTRFFFVVDRLDLARQAASEFKARGLTVIQTDSKADFTKELKRPLSSKTDMGSKGEVCVVNIQKFEGEMPNVQNDYNIECQRVFFVDEAHRSYKMTGEFFKNLMTCDMNGVYIALTGTPLLSARERSSLKFGDYIHKYFYDKSIADGYTLRIKKENIDTVAKAEIKNNLEFESSEINMDSKDVFESDSYIDSLGHFIEKDFKNFRLQNADPTIGGMVVCRTNAQAKKMHQWFEGNSQLKTGLVISDDADATQAVINKNNQINFRESDKPDMLVVNYMLTTGYDVKRLKKMYLLRGPHAQNLLQTISRVNRPYKSPTGKIYKYGYIVDFVDIEDEYDRTLAAYLKELEKDFDDTGEGGTLGGLIVDKDTINEKYQKLVKEIQEMGIDTSNLESFSKMLVMFNIETLRKLKRIFDGMRECYIEFVLSNADEYLKNIDDQHLKLLARTTKERINFINLSEDSVSMMDIISNDEIAEIIYEFIKTKILVLDLSQFDPSSATSRRFMETVKQVQAEVKKNKNKDDIEVIKLNELLQKVFQKLNISDLSDLDDITEELLEALEKARKINNENDRLAEAYDGNFALVKTYQDTIGKYVVDRSITEATLKIIYDEIKDVVTSDSLIIQGKKNFIDSIKSKVTKKLIKEGLYKHVKTFYDDMLGDLYFNIQTYKEI